MLRAEGVWELPHSWVVTDSEPTWDPYTFPAFLPCQSRGRAVPWVAEGVPLGKDTEPRGEKGVLPEATCPQGRLAWFCVISHLPSALTPSSAWIHEQATAAPCDNPCEPQVLAGCRHKPSGGRAFPGVGQLWQGQGSYAGAVSKG